MPDWERIQRCKCGCGEAAPIALRTDSRRDYVQGQPVDYIRGHNSCRERKSNRFVEEDCGYLTPCWIWRLVIHKNGYGTVQVRGRRWQAHIWMWVQRNGPVPAGQQLDHLCKVRACVNPDHLEPVTPVENVRRSSATRLTLEQAREIKASVGTNIAVAARYGVSDVLVSLIRRGKVWVDA
jgi:hypothetical protein